MKGWLQQVSQKNMNKVGNQIKETLEDVLYSFRRKIKRVSVHFHITCKMCCYKEKKNKGAIK